MASGTSDHQQLLRRVHLPPLLRGSAIGGVADGDLVVKQRLFAPFAFSRMELSSDDHHAADQQGCDDHERNNLAHLTEPSSRMPSW
jgi:hypothetical protein